MQRFKSKGWDELFEESKNRWKKPNKYIHLLRDEVKKKFEKKRVLDIGCGTGRHISYLHSKGFDVSGFDIASNVRNFVGKTEKAKLKKHDMNVFPWPYKSESFEGALAINVIHHTNYKNFVKIVNEINRILVKSGFFLGTIVSKKNHKFRCGKKIDEYTYLTDVGAEKGIPHCFLDEKDIKKIFEEGFRILELKLISGEIPEKDKKFKKEGALDHWLVFAQKK